MREAFISFVIAGLARRRNELPQLLTSSSAKADDPVFRAAEDARHAGDYWIPAFAGMTAVRAGRAARFSITPASASARRARLWNPCPAPASASPDRPIAAPRLRPRSEPRCPADSAN